MEVPMYYYSDNPSLMSSFNLEVDNKDLEA